VVEGLDVLDKLNSAQVDPASFRPIQNIRIRHTLVIDEGSCQPIPGLVEPERSPSPVRVVEGGDGFIEDDVDLGVMAETMNEE